LIEDLHKLERRAVGRGAIRVGTAPEGRGVGLAGVSAGVKTLGQVHIAARDPRGHDQKPGPRASGKFVLISGQLLEMLDRFHIIRGTKCLFGGGTVVRRRPFLWGATVGTRNQEQTREKKSPRGHCANGAGVHDRTSVTECFITKAARVQPLKAKSRSASRTPRDLECDLQTGRVARFTSVNLELGDGWIWTNNFIGGR